MQQCLAKSQSGDSWVAAPYCRVSEVRVPDLIQDLIQEAIETALKLFKGEKVEKKMTLKSRVFTKENIDKGGEVLGE